MDVLCIGEALIDFVSHARVDSLVDATQYDAATGGAPANVAAGLAKFNRHARLISTVGSDVYGDKIIHDLEAVGVDCSMRRAEHHFTTMAFVRHIPDGGREFIFNVGAHERLIPEQVTDDDLKNTRVLHYGSVSWRAENTRQTVLKAIDLAKKYGVVISCSPDWRPNLWETPEDGTAAMCEAIEHADVIRTSLNDLGQLVPDHGGDYAAAIKSVGFQGRLAVITLGSAGAWYTTGDRTGQVPTPAVKVVDTTGSGDAFTATLLDSLLDHDLAVDTMSEEELDRVMYRACAAGALTATGYGAIPSLPDDEQIAALMRMVEWSRARSHQ